MRTASLVWVFWSTYKRIKANKVSRLFSQPEFVSSLLCALYATPSACPRGAYSFCGGWGGRAAQKWGQLAGVLSAQGESKRIGDTHIQRPEANEWRGRKGFGTGRLLPLKDGEL